MTRHFCDKCGKELTARELKFSLEMTGKELCSKHAGEIIEQSKTTYSKKADWKDL